MTQTHELALIHEVGVGSGTGRTTGLTRNEVQGARVATATGQGFGRQATLGECQSARVRSVGACGARALMHRSAQTRVLTVLYSSFPQGERDEEGQREGLHRSHFSAKSGRIPPPTNSHRVSSVRGCRLFSCPR